MGLTLGRAKIFEHVAGIVVTPSMHDVLAAEAEVSKAHAQARSLERLALQIIGLRLMGYAGIHLSGIHDTEQLDALERSLEHWQARLHSLEQWAPAWRACWQMPGLPDVTFHPPGANWRLGESQVSASPKETARYYLLHGLHSLLFSRRNPLSQAFGWAVQRPLWNTPPAPACSIAWNAVRKGLWSGATPAVPAAWKTPSTSARKPAPKAWPTAPAAAPRSTAASSATASASTA